MKSRFCKLGSCLVALAAFAIAGCNDASSPPAGKEIVSEGPPETLGEGHSHDDGHDHAHPSEGPHGGGLIELGEEEYHAELVHEGANVTIYVLDSAASNAVPIDAKEVTINLKHDGKPEQFQLAATPLDGEGEGKASRFTIESADLAAQLDAEGSGARLMLSIAGKSYSGGIEHHHDHDGHDHAHARDH